MIGSQPLANKHARILWAVLAKGERFDPFYAPARTGGAAGAKPQTTSP
jgi:hypothetical protein